MHGTWGRRKTTCDEQKNLSAILTICFFINIFFTFQFIHKKLNNVLIAVNFKRRVQVEKKRRQFSHSKNRWTRQGRFSSFLHLHISFSIFVSPKHWNFWSGALVLWLWEEIYIQDVVGSDPSTGYWMDINHILL